MKPRRRKRTIWLKRSALAVSVVALIIVAVFFLLWLDARITPPKMQKHKWMLTETFGTGILPLDAFGMSLEEMDERLQGRGFERALGQGLDPEFQWMWQAHGVEVLYSIPWRNNLIIHEISDGWELDSGAKFGEWKTLVQRVYGVPDRTGPRSLAYIYMPDSRRYFKAVFGFSEQGRLESAGYAFRRRTLVDRLRLSVPSR